MNIVTMKGEKCVKHAFSFVGKMRCYQVCLLVFVILGFSLLTFWNLKPKGQTSRTRGSKSFNYVDGNEIGDTVKDDPSNLELPRKMLGLIDWTHLSGPDLTYRIEEMVRIKNSVQKELTELEKQRGEMQRQVRKCVLVGICIQPKMPFK